MDFETMSKLNQELITKKREEFLSERARQELLIKQWGENMMHIKDKPVFEGLVFPEEISLKSFVPEWYKDAPNQAIYDEQFDKMMELINECNRRAFEWNKKQAELVQDYTLFAESLQK